MYKNKSQSGSAHLIIIIVLATALIGSLSFVFYQNFIQNKEDSIKVDVEKTDDESKTTTPTPSPTTQATPTVDPSTVVNNFLTSFLDYMNSPESSEVIFATQSSDLTDEYKNRITNPSGIVPVSPIILAQALPLGFTIGDVTTTSTTSSVSVNWNFNSSFNVVYNLVLVNNEWKIDGVTRA